MRNIASGKYFRRPIDMIIAAGPAPVMCFVTAQSHPHLFEVFERIAAQEGFGVGHRTFYISSAWEAQINEAEQALVDAAAGREGDTISSERVRRFQAMRRLVEAVQQT